MTEATRVHLPSRRALAAFLCPTVLFIAGIAAAQEQIDPNTVNRIRDTALNHSEIMEMVGYLTDVTGPRLPLPISSENHQVVAHNALSRRAEIIAILLGSRPSPD
jgi:hypothetical protein